MLCRARRVQKGLEMHDVSEGEKEGGSGTTHMHVECIRKYKHEKITAL
jgi:hypothetical protein